ncbi:hypothetical protein [Phytoactinopolyspora halotolerans]|uniref:Uncharacterized protein n=1 Tax=Phytoactinopolyspora halotolerans TaxID=1981512 RepID=A0A6L9S3F2_9ACTN|nr:hypothetical protein [Phytoactinopolyspora halotolerans]NED99163.1 hypothetical protein [Phytoactinopolyspora halotolerans]
MSSDETEDTRADELELDALVRELRQVLGTTPDEAFGHAEHAAHTHPPQHQDDQTDDE